ncbi:MAG: sulfurtransferase [Candidatus Methylomirabilales bacterium]
MSRLARHPFVWASAAVILLLSSTTAHAEYSGNQATTQGYANASLLESAQEVADHLRDPQVRILDARSPDRYAAGHILGAVNLPVAEITRTIDGVPGMLPPIKEVERALGRRGITRDTRVVVYDDFGGDRATRLFWILDSLGHPRVSVLQGGFALWQQEGRPTSREISNPKTTRYQGDPRPNRAADRNWIRNRLKDPLIVLVDARSPAEFDGKVPGPDVRRPGHIPGAVNVDWVRNLTTTEPRRFKTAADLAQLYRRAGATSDKEIVLYCRTGMRASHDYFVLRLLGYPRVRLYDGSYVDWAATATSPVAK